MNGDANYRTGCADAGMLEKFLSRLPIVYSIAILSPHGFFGQHDVLGKPDTGGQVHKQIFEVLCP